MLPQAARDVEAEQDSIVAIATRGVVRLWHRMRGRTWSQAWRDDVGPAAVEVVEEAQRASALTSTAYVASVLAELGIETDVNTSLNADALVGVTGDGIPVEDRLYGAVTTAASAMYTAKAKSLDLEQAAQQALVEAEAWIAAETETILADAARAAETVATAQRPWVTGYIRMVEPGACSRCVILAGAFYLYNEGFLRHPRCKCRHIPADENVAGDMRTNPAAYFGGLTPAEQAKTFTAAGAEAIRLGADPAQVVNARRGMQTAQIYGRRALITTTGTTKRGRAAGVPVRLMPETILAEAKDPQDALRLLIRFGYVL